MNKEMEVSVTKVVTAVIDWDAAANKLTIREQADSHVILTFTNEIIDSGALVGHLPEGQIVIPAQNDHEFKIDEKDRLARGLIRNGFIEPLDKTWRSFGGQRWQAARVLVD